MARLPCSSRISNCLSFQTIQSPTSRPRASFLCCGQQCRERLDLSAIRAQVPRRELDNSTICPVPERWFLVFLCPLGPRSRNPVGIDLDYRVENRDHSSLPSTTDLQEEFLSRMIRLAAGGGAKLKLDLELAPPGRPLIRKLRKPEARARGWGQRNGWTKGPEARQTAKPGGFGVLPNPSLALQASMARKVSFPNGASSAGGRT